MNKYVIIFILLVVVIVGWLFYSNGYLVGGNRSGTYTNNELPESYPNYLFPLYNNSVVNEIIEGEEDSITISFLSKDGKEELGSYYSNILTDAYQISGEDKNDEYTSFGMKDEFIYSISVSSSRTKYNNENYNSITTIGVMPMDDELKEDMKNMTEKEKEVMLIWFKAINEME